MSIYRVYYRVRLDLVRVSVGISGKRIGFMLISSTIEGVELGLKYTSTIFFGNRDLLSIDNSRKSKATFRQPYCRLTGEWALALILYQSVEFEKIINNPFGRPKPNPSSSYPLRADEVSGMVNRYPGCGKLRQYHLCHCRANYSSIFGEEPEAAEAFVEHIQRMFLLRNARVFSSDSRISFICTGN